MNRFSFYFGHEIIFFFCLFFLIISLPLVCSEEYYDCCSKYFSHIGSNGCQSPTTIGNYTYYCVDVETTCDSCYIASSLNITSGSCYRCCVANKDDCNSSYSYITSSSWTLICIIFAGSCCCCSIVFLSAEHNRMKEGISFREAYLLPIPLVAAELDFEDKEYIIPPDQPTAIARTHTIVDVPVAEPTENSALMGLYYPERDSLWD